MIAVFGVKGSPGATTTALLMTALWPDINNAVVVGADPAGDDLPLRLSGPNGQVLPSTPSIAQLAVDAAKGSDLSSGLWAHALQTSVGIPAVLGLPSPEPMEQTIRQHGSRLATALAGHESVIVDAGRLIPSSPALVFAATADVVALVVPDSLEGCFHARDLLSGLVAASVRTGGVRSVVQPIVIADPRRADAAATQLAEAIASRSIPTEAPVSIAWDPRTVSRMLAAGLHGTAKSALVRSAEPVTGILYQAQTRVRSERGLTNNMSTSTQNPYVPRSGAPVGPAHTGAAPADPSHQPAAADPGTASPIGGAVRQRPSTAVPTDPSAVPQPASPFEPQPRSMPWPPPSSSGEWGSRHAG